MIATAPPSVRALPITRGWAGQGGRVLGRDAARGVIDENPRL